MLVVVVIVLGLVPIPLVGVATLVLMSGGLQWPGQPPPPPDPLWIPAALLLLLNFVAPVAFALRSRSYGWWLQTGVQAIDLFLAVAIVANAPTIDAGSWPELVCAGCCLVTVGLLLVLRYHPAAREAGPAGVG